MNDWLHTNVLPDPKAGSKDTTRFPWPYGTDDLPVCKRWDGEMEQGPHAFRQSASHEEADLCYVLRVFQHCCGSRTVPYWREYCNQRATWRHYPEWERYVHMEAYSFSIALSDRFTVFSSYLGKIRYSVPTFSLFSGLKTSLLYREISLHQESAPSLSSKLLSLYLLLFLAYFFVVNILSRYLVLYNFILVLKTFLG